MSDTSEGPGWWQASDGKWYPPQDAPAAAPPPPPVAAPVPPPQQQWVAPPQKSGVNGCLIAFLVVVGLVFVAVIGFFLVAAFVVSETVDQIDNELADYSASQEEMAVIEEETGIETSSANLENPPQYDLVDPVNCDIEGRPLVATGEVVNNSSETSDYFITVAFEENSGTRFDQATAVLNRVAPGERVRWEATTFTAEDPGGTDIVGCRVTQMDRISVDVGVSVPLEE